VAREPNATLFLVSCVSYLNTVVFRVLKVAKYCTSCSPWKSGCDLHTWCDWHMHCVEACLVASGLCKHLHTRTHLHDTRVSCRVAWKCALWFAQEYPQAMCMMWLFSVTQ